MQNKYFLNKAEIKDTINRVILVGALEGAPTYSHSFDDVNYYSARMQVIRGNRPKSDNLHVFIPETLLVGETLLDTGIRLRVEGYLVQSKLHGKNDVSVVATSVTTVTAEDPDENVLFLGGVIHKSLEMRQIKDTEKVIKTLILKHTSGPEEKPLRLTVKISCWNNTAKLVDQKYNEGDAIVIRGQLESKYVKLDREKPNSDDNRILLHEGVAAVVLSVSE